MNDQEPLSTAVPDDPEARSADGLQAALRDDFDVKQSLGRGSMATVHGRLPDQTPYLVMRFVTDRTMEERLKAEGRLPAAVAKGGLHDIAPALAAAHAAAIVHSDVRLANVFWDEEGEKGLPATA